MSLSKKVRRRHHPKSRVKQNINIIEVSVECVRAFDAEPAADDFFRLAAFEKVFQIGFRLDENQFSVRIYRLYSFNLFGLVKGAFREARKIFERLALGEREPENIVSFVRVAFDI